MEKGLGYSRPQSQTLEKRLLEPRRFLQVVAGPRQVGKTTLVQQVLARLGTPSRYASADEPSLRGGEWIAQQWEAARATARASGRAGAVLALDEVQKIPGWSEAVKRLWDEDSASRLRLRVVLLGSAPLLVQRGVSESLTGRFEVISLPHWSFGEMRAAFGWDLPTFIYFGGYPGAAPLVSDPKRWQRYVQDSLVETTLSRDILLLTRVDKPSLLRRLFDLSCRYSGQILSYTKMLGQLQDAGNTTTLAHYLDLLGASGMVVGLQKYAEDAARRRGSSPKLQVLNTALMSALAGLSPTEARSDCEHWGRLVESAVGAHLVGEADASRAEIFYWRDRGHEVDFVVRAGHRLLAIEVKSAARKGGLSGTTAFCSMYPSARPLLVGGDGIPIEEFLAAPLLNWLRQK